MQCKKRFSILLEENITRVLRLVKCWVTLFLVFKSIFSVTHIEVTFTQDYLTFFQVSRGQKYLISTPPEVKHISTQTTGDHLRSIYSQRPVTLNNNTSTSGWYTADVAPSTLLWLAGPKTV